MALFNRTKWLELETPSPSEMLLPNVDVINKQPHEPLDLLTLAQEGALRDAGNLPTAPLHAALIDRFSDDRNDEQQRRYVEFTCTRSADWGWSIGSVEQRKFHPPEFKTHPITHTALALTFMQLPDESFPDGNWKVAAVFCIRAGYFYFRVGEPALPYLGRPRK